MSKTVPFEPGRAPADAPGEARADRRPSACAPATAAFFPVSYSAIADRLQGLEDMCHALCPNADVSPLHLSRAGDIEQAVSIERRALHG